MVYLECGTLFCSLAFHLVFPRIPQVIWTYHSCSMFRTLRRRSWVTVTWIDPKSTNQKVALVVVYRGYLLNLLDYRNIDSPKYMQKNILSNKSRTMEFLHFFVSWLIFVSDDVVCLSQDVCWTKKTQELKFLDPRPGWKNLRKNSTKPRCWFGLTWLTLC